jgi:hypothetical protein
MANRCRSVLTPASQAPKDSIHKILSRRLVPIKAGSLSTPDPSLFFLIIASYSMLCFDL